MRILKYAINVATVLLLVLCCVVWLRGAPPNRATMAALPVDFKLTERTLILIVRQECPYCAESLPFYRRLIDIRNRDHNAVRIVVSAPQRDAEIGRYLEANSVSPDAIVHPGPGVMPSWVRLTPTLLLVGRDGNLLRMWEGLIPERNERAVLETIFR